MNAASLFIVLAILALVILGFTVGAWWVRTIEFYIQDQIDFHMKRIHETWTDPGKIRGDPSRQLQEPRNQSKGTQVDFDNLPRLPFQQTTGYPVYVFPSDLGDLSRENVLHEATAFFCKQPDRMLKLISAFHDEEGRQKVTLEKSLRGILKKWQDAKIPLCFPRYARDLRRLP